MSPIQAALRLNNSVTVFFPVPLALHTFFVNEGTTQNLIGHPKSESDNVVGRLEKEEYLRTWRSISAEASEEISGLPSSDVSALQPKLEANKVFFVAQRNAEGHVCLSKKFIFVFAIVSNFFVKTFGDVLTTE